MQRAPIPFNVGLLELTPQRLQLLKPVTSLDIFDNMQQLHPDGLFSTVIFGKVGDELRNKRFSYIDIKVQIFHPVIYRAIHQLKRFHTEIISGREYAVWDDEAKDFERSNLVEGHTGFDFFMQHWPNIIYPKNKSDQREQNIMLIEKYRKKALTDKVLVMPAGLRDVEIDTAGRVSMDEINGFYKAILGISNTITANTVKSNPELLNRPRFRLQTAFNDLYAHIENMIQGKKKFLLGAWASRSPMYGTRNVITAMDTNTEILGAPGAVRMNDTIIGLFQTLKAYTPVTRFHIRNKYLPLIFTTVDRPAKLVNPKTLKADMVMLRPEYFDRWNTDEGVEHIITSFGEESLRHKPLMVNGHYMGLIYKGKDGSFKFFQDIDELPTHLDRADVSPITFCEFLYMSVYEVMNNYPLFVTRYPITGVGSIYPSKVYMMSTTHKEKRVELDHNWQPTQSIAYNFPIRGAAFMNSLAPHPVHISPLSADFDGDMCSANGTYSDESIKEIDKFMTQKKAYVGTDGRFIYETGTDTVSYVMHNLTGDPE